MFNLFRCCEILELFKSTKEFIFESSEDFFNLMKHNFSSESQAKSFALIKDRLKDRKFVVSLGFAMNCTSTTQNSIQAHHWSKMQTSLHPLVVYCRDGGKTKQFFLCLSNNSVFFLFRSLNF